MSFFSNLRHRGHYDPHMGSGYFQQQPYPAGQAGGQPTMLCPGCQAGIPSGSNFCPSCGTKIAQNIARKCGQCGAIASGGSRFCSNCGAKV